MGMAEDNITANGTPKIMVFHPTWDEFKNFSAYIDYIESKGAHKAGLAKVGIVRKINVRRILEESSRFIMA